MDLQNTFYVLGIIYMGLMTIIIIALVIAVFAIKAKINAIQSRIEEKFHAIAEVMNMGEAIFNKVQSMTDHHKR